MSEHCLSKNPLVRDGTSQRQRLLKTLLPSYVPVDERSMKDLVNFARKFTGEVNYFESSSTSDDGQWDVFFKLTDEDWSSFSLEDFIAQLKETGETDPHIALFLGFLYMFQTAQDDLNTLTRRHLEFYYRDVLQLKEKPAVPDQVAIIFKLAKHVDQHLVKAGTALKAGKDALGVERIYKLKRDLVVGKAEITSLKSVFIDVNDRFSTELDYDPLVDHRIFKSPTANSADGLGADIETENMSWRTFGEPQFSKDTSPPVPDREQAEIGFAIASPILFLAEGDRTITLNFDLDQEITDTLSADDFKFLFSGEEEWIPADPDDAESGTDGGDPYLKFVCKLGAEDPSVVRYNQEVLGEPYSTNWPIIKVLLNTEAENDPFTYQYFKERLAGSVTISVDVDGVKNLVLQNDQAVLDASKPFLPFGNQPYLGSNFYVGSWEVFQKKLTSLDIHFKWNELPQGTYGFYSHYLGYNDHTGFVYRSNDEFRIDISLLHEKKWETLKDDARLLTDPDGNSIYTFATLPAPDADPSKIIVGTSSDPELNAIPRQTKLQPFTDFNVDTKKGFLRITLQNQDFGHKAFPNSYAEKAIDLADGGTGSLPNQPYTPTIQNLSVDYESEVSFPLSGEESNVEQFFHIEPFGAWQIDTTQSNTYLLPRFNNAETYRIDEGNLYIGISNMTPPQSLSVLFQVLEGSANPVKTHPGIEWSYLSNNEWKPFDKDKEILINTTNGLLTSGIIQFAIPKDATSNNTRLPSGQHWLKASVPNNADAICRLIDVQAQAVLAEFEDQGNDPDHLENPLEAETISKLQRSNSAIDSVIQPYASFGGKMEEQQSAFYTRTSERLRHKQRAIAIWDYEHLVLQQFPSVYKVKCINHTRFEGNLSDYSEIAPGHVTCIVVSNVQNQNAVDKLRPMTSLDTLTQIDEYLQTIISESVELHVKNPIYEEIQVEFNVQFRFADTGFYLQKLNEDIKEFLAPWSSDCGADISFGGRIHKSMILNFVEERSYVDYVTCFKMYHKVEGSSDIDPNEDVDEAEATTAVSILGSVENHDITAIAFGSEECDCEDNEIKSTDEWASADDCGCQEEITSLPGE
ncbi:baseplate J/gp47 family protein [Aliifodinibius sp. S!AR15-10]|uniref:baseplate J/gp47 family protein n=1 Tax=Aliifodinibius sp. S!AR15-10 TaxID=2950437 RepID=UPI00286589E6|nr:baseplate J/gp47 family protein [Aliifodinibius sp. S!AR15-10]MDR8390611.1 baseplate J/gp47 family protein [Aliifodinibius sp. S!AR15-10]